MEQVIPMRIAVLGAGALGGFVGGKLAQSGQAAVLIDVDRSRIESINRLGLRLETQDADRRIAIRASHASDIDERYDLIIVLTKGVHTEGAISSCRHLLHDNTYVLTFQNGLGNAAVLARHVDRRRIVIGMTNWAADLKGPDHVASVGTGEIRIWHVDRQDDSYVRTIATLLDRAGLNCRADREVETAIWEKVAFNAAINSIAAVTLRNVGEIGDDPDARSLVDEVALEVLTVARAKSIPADIGRVTSMVTEAFRDHRSHKPSMLQDMLAGRQTEIETINGAVVLEAAQLGLKIPATECLCKLVKTLERRVRPTSAPNIREDV